MNFANNLKFLSTHLASWRRKPLQLTNFCTSPLPKCRNRHKKLFKLAKVAKKKYSQANTRETRRRWQTKRKCDFRVKTRANSCVHLFYRWSSDTSRGICIWQRSRPAERTFVPSAQNTKEFQMITTNSLITKLRIISTTPRCALETSLCFCVSSDRCQPSSSSRHTWAVRSFTWAATHTKTNKKKDAKMRGEKTFPQLLFFRIAVRYQKSSPYIVAGIFSVWQKKDSLLAPNQARPRNSFRHKTIENRDFSPLSTFFFFHSCVISDFISSLNRDRLVLSAQKKNKHRTALWSVMR